MNLTEMEEEILDELYHQHLDESGGDFVLRPAPGDESSFEKALKRLDLGGLIDIEERFGGNKAVLQLTPKGRESCEHRRGEVDVETWTVELEAIDVWDEPPQTEDFVSYDELEGGDTFEDQHGHEWTVPEKAANPDGAQRILNRTVTDYRRGTAGVVPERAWVRKLDW